MSSATADIPLKTFEGIVSTQKHVFLKLQRVQIVIAKIQSEKIEVKWTISFSLKPELLDYDKLLLFQGILSKPLGQHKIKHLIYIPKIKIKHKESLCTWMKISEQQEKTVEETAKNTLQDKREKSSTIPVLSPHQTELL